MTEPFEPVLLTVLYWFLVSVIAICGVMCWKIGRSLNSGPVPSRKIL